MTETEKMTELERSVLLDTPEELDKTCKRLEIIDKSGRALGLACHFRGLDWAKVLVNNGAAFKNGDKWLYHELCYRNPNGLPYYDMQEDLTFSLLDPRFLLMGMSQTWKGSEGIAEDNIIAFDGKIDAVSEEERLKCVRYFIGLDNNRVCDLQYLLYLAIMHCDRKAAELLREKGVTIPQDVRNILTNGEKANKDYIHFYRFPLSFMTADELIWVVTELSRDMESGKFITVNSDFMEYIKEVFPDPRVFDCILSHFDNKKINKKRNMQEIILTGKSDLLEVCEKHGWLKFPKKRDEIIKFAADNDKTECTAWLLEFKSRTADLKAEQEKAEKKLIRELNADPNSVTELKKLWGFERREDGGIVITRYKGKRAEVNVPEMIGKDTVRAIGEYAFSPDAVRLTEEQKELRRNITKIVLPETVEIIGKFAFCHCEGLSSINIPKAVKMIEDDTFYSCKSLISVNMPNGVKSIGEHAFFECEKLSEIDIPLSVKEIRKNAFCSCTSLISVNLPDEITKISYCCFAGCEKLQSVTIPPTVKRIESLAFWQCSSLEEITIPEGVKEIDVGAFADCSKLRSVTLPKSVNLIENAMQRSKTPRTIFSTFIYTEQKEELLVTVTVPAGSYAEEYCKTNNIHYIIKNSVSDT